MPKFATELAQGQAFSRSVDENGLSDTFVRVFKVVLTSPSEVFDPQTYCNVFIGNPHPLNPNLTCYSFDAKFDGDSRMVSIVTFNYKSYASSAGSSSGSGDHKQKAPDERPANWSTDTSLMEMPCDSWRKWSKANPTAYSPWSFPINMMGDRYDGVSKLAPITTIRIEQHESFDPLRNTNWVGYINEDVIFMGGWKFEAHTLMLRGVSSKAHIETFGTKVFRGWTATYEIAHKNNVVEYVGESGGKVVEALGWDRLQPLEGLYVKNDRLGDADVDEYGLSLQHADYKVLSTAPTPTGYTYAASDGKSTQGQRMRAMVGFPCPTGGWAQRPSASPIALNKDGTPRNLRDVQADGVTPVRYPILYRYQTQNSTSFMSNLNLRLF